jgi:hypothetical protein
MLREGHSSGTVYAKGERIHTMQRILLLSLLTSSLFLHTGCSLTGMREARVARARAASDLGCPESEVNVHSVAGNGYVAYGCSKSVQLTCLTSTNPNPLFPNIKEQEVACMSGNVHDEGPDVTAADVNAKHAEDKKAAEAKAAADDEAEDEARKKAFTATLRTVLKSIPYRDCGKGGAGKIEITVEPKGLTRDVVVVEGAYDAPTSACVAERFKHVRVDAFGGEPRTYTWKIELPKSEWD